MTVRRRDKKYAPARNPGPPSRAGMVPPARSSRGGFVPGSKLHAGPPSRAGIQPTPSARDGSVPRSKLNPGPRSLYYDIESRPAVAGRAGTVPPAFSSDSSSKFGEQKELSDSAHDCTGLLEKMYVVAIKSMRRPAILARRRGPGWFRRPVHRGVDSSHDRNCMPARRRGPGFSRLVGDGTDCPVTRNVS